MPVSIRRLQPDPLGSKATRSRSVRRNQRPTHDRDPTRNCRRHHVCKVCLAMEEYRRRLERTQLKIYAALLVLLFGGILILPRIGQVIWIAIVTAIYIRVALVIARREELLEKLSPRSQGTERAAWYDPRDRLSTIAMELANRACFWHRGAVRFGPLRERAGRVFLHSSKYEPQAQRRETRAWGPRRPSGRNAIPHKAAVLGVAAVQSTAAKTKSGSQRRSGNN